MDRVAPKVSIVIINKNDRGVADTLRTIAGLPCPVPCETLVVDASGGKLDDIYRQFPAVRQIPFVSTSKKHITIPEQRNTGVRAAKGKIIVFTDANCIPDHDWLEQLLHPILNGGEAIVAGKALSKGTHTIHDIVADTNKDKKYIYECPTINLAFTKELYDRVGPFDEGLKYGSDVDFSWRVQDAGYKVRYNPQAIIRHDWGSFKQELKRSFRYGEARARLYRKHTHRIKYLFTRDITALVYPVYLGLLPVTIIFPWYPLVILIPLLRNWRVHPHKVVLDHLVYAVGVWREVFRLP
jgi:glycosyltransferase involved in cell wall biosynthesis